MHKLVEAPFVFASGLGERVGIRNPAKHSDAPLSLECIFALTVVHSARKRRTELDATFGQVKETQRNIDESLIGATTPVHAFFTKLT